MARKVSSTHCPALPLPSAIDFEAKLWLTSDKLRNIIDVPEPERSGDSQPQAARRASEAKQYKHVVLSLIFLKYMSYMSDTFAKHRAKLLAGQGVCAGANAEDPDEYKAQNVFWVPAGARWPHVQGTAKQPIVGKIVDNAKVAIERDNPCLKGVLQEDYAHPCLKGVLHEDYAHPGLKKQRLAGLIDVIATIEPTAAGESETPQRSVDLLGRVYEYHRTLFPSAEGKNGGHSSGIRKTAKRSPQGEYGGVPQFYHPNCVVRCLVEMRAPHKDRIYNPACSSGGMFAQSEKFVESHGRKLSDISTYCEDSNTANGRLAVMNLALRGIEADFGPEHAETFRRAPNEADLLIGSN
jgi:type I restriction enzyme M protein